MLCKVRSVMQVWNIDTSSKFPFENFPRIRISPFPWMFFQKVFLKDFTCLFMRERETERQRHKQREKQVPCREPDVGLDPGSPGSHPGLKAALNCWATQDALQKVFFFFNWKRVQQSSYYIIRNIWPITEAQWISQAWNPLQKRQCLCPDTLMLL